MIVIKRTVAVPLRVTLGRGGEITRVELEESAIGHVCDAIDANERLNIVLQATRCRLDEGLVRLVSHGGPTEYLTLVKVTKHHVVLRPRRSSGSGDEKYKRTFGTLVGEQWPTRHIHDEDLAILNTKAGDRGVTP